MVAAGHWASIYPTETAGPATADPRVTTGVIKTRRPITDPIARNPHTPHTSPLEPAPRADLPCSRQAKATEEVAQGASAVQMGARGEGEPPVVQSDGPGTARGKWRVGKREKCQPRPSSLCDERCVCAADASRGERMVRREMKRGSCKHFPIWVCQSITGRSRA